MEISTARPEIATSPPKLEIIIIIINNNKDTKVNIFTILNGIGEQKNERASWINFLFLILGNCVCQTCVNKYKYLAASGQLVSASPPALMTTSVSSSFSNPSSSSPSPTELSSSVSSTSSLTNNDHHHHHLQQQQQTSHHHNQISPNSLINPKRKTLSVDTLAENLAQKRLKQLQMTGNNSSTPTATTTAKNFSVADHHNHHQHQQQQQHHRNNNNTNNNVKNLKNQSSSGGGAVMGDNNKFNIKNLLQTGAHDSKHSNLMSGKANNNNNNQISQRPVKTIDPLQQLQPQLGKNLGIFEFINLKNFYFICLFCFKLV